MDICGYIFLWGPSPEVLMYYQKYFSPKFAFKLQLSCVPIGKHSFCYAHQL